jgi:hypothetical protein
VPYAITRLSDETTSLSDTTDATDSAQHDSIKTGTVKTGTILTTVASTTTASLHTTTDSNQDLRLFPLGSNSASVDAMTSIDAIENYISQLHYSNRNP